MHDIEPHFSWRDLYIASQDEVSPFHGRQYDEFKFTQKVYNYFIHPQWDHFGSPTLYMKILYVDYQEKFAIYELIGEWNDCITNDIMYLKRDVADYLIDQGITKHLFICENVFNFHGSDDCYYEEWYEDIVESGGWITFINLLTHVEEEMKNTNLHGYVNLGGRLNDFPWRKFKPEPLFKTIDQIVNLQIKSLNSSI